MADTSKPDQDLTSRGQDLPPSTKEKPPEDVVIEQENESEIKLSYKIAIFFLRKVGKSTNHPQTPKYLK